ncbi:Microprocessor complex subunit DGCR8 [Schistosoma japonicum]|nr:Microprocessor complex subunit DGCR8 [Schistosoma japonicum]
MDVQLRDDSLDTKINESVVDCLGTRDKEDCERNNSNLNSNKGVPDSLRFKGKRPVMKEKRFVINDMVETVDFGLLPEGWLQLRHVSGLNIYLHRQTRVVTLSKPYSIGPCSVRHHRIPVSAIPCLAYRKANGQIFHVAESHEVPSRSTDPVNELHSINETECYPLEKPSEKSITPDNSNAAQELELHDDSLECEVSAVNGQEDKLIVTGTLTTNDASLSFNNTDSLSLFDISDEEIDLLKSKTSDKEEGELSSGDDEKENSVDANRVKKPRLDDDVNGGDMNSANRSSCETLSQTLLSLRLSYRMVLNQHVIRFYFYNRRALSDYFIMARDCSAVSMQVTIWDNVFSIKDKEKESLLTPDDIREYCGRLFEIRVEDTVFQRNRENNCQLDSTKESEETQKPLLMMSEQAKVIRYQLPSADGNVSRKQPKEGMINMTGKSYVCILHEYCQNVIRHPPTYQTTVLENDKNPYQMTVFINGTPYGTGTGQSKKCARLEAARKALEVLIPDFQKIVCTSTHQTGPVVASDRDMQLFDSISVTDPRLYELSVRMALPTPYNLLVECLSRNCVPESDLKSSMISQGRSKHFFTLQLREHTVKVRCKNKREGRHLSAQHLLARLHPEVSTWSGLLRMYGPGSKPDKKNELETIQDAQIQQKSAVKASLIRLLKAKMNELADQWEKSDGSIHPKGKFFVSPYNLPVVAFHPDSEGDLYSSLPIASSSSSLTMPPTAD